MSLSRLADRTVLFLPVKTVSADPPETKIFSNFLSTSKTKNTALIDVSIALNLFHGMSGAKSTDYHGSCSFLLMHLYWNVSFGFYLCFGRQLR